VQDLFNTGCYKRRCLPRPAKQSLGNDTLIVEPGSDKEDVAIVLRGHLGSPRCVAGLKAEFGHPQSQTLGGLGGSRGNFPAEASRRVQQKGSPPDNPRGFQGSHDFRRDRWSLGRAR
jgi:hypothetical protein